MCVVGVQRLEPAEFILSERAPVVLNSVFITLMFCSGMPLLLPIACVTMALTYWVDKYAILRVYAKPPTMGSDLANVRCCVHACGVCAFPSHGVPTTILLTWCSTPPVRALS